MDQIENRLFLESNKTIYKFRIKDYFLGSLFLYICFMNDLNFNIFNLIIISGVLHGLIFSSIIITQKKHISNNTLYLGVTVLFLSLSNFQYWLIDTGITNKYKFLSYVFIPWQWLILPMFYLYVHKFIDRKRITSKIKIFLISPFFIVVLIHVFQIINNFYLNENFELTSHFQKGIYVYLEFISFIFNVLIIILVYRMVVKHERNKSFDLDWVKSETNWLKQLVYTGLAVCLCWIIALIIVLIYNLNETYIFYPLWIGISILVYWIGYVGIEKSNQLRNRIKLRKKRISDFSKNKSLENSKSKSNGFDKIESYFKINKSYLNPNLSLQVLSKELDLSEGHLSQLINNSSNVNFNDYINSYRINDAKKMLENTEYENYTIVAIGLEAGFNSKSSFYTAFKKHTGKTPLEYKNNVRNL